MEPLSPALARTSLTSQKSEKRRVERAMFHQKDQSSRRGVDEGRNEGEKIEQARKGVISSRSRTNEKERKEKQNSSHAVVFVPLTTPHPATPSSPQFPKPTALVPPPLLFLSLPLLLISEPTSFFVPEHSASPLLPLPLPLVRSSSSLILLRRRVGFGSEDLGMSDSSTSRILIDALEDGLSR